MVNVFFRSFVVFIKLMFFVSTFGFVKATPKKIFKSVKKITYLNSQQLLQNLGRSSFIISPSVIEDLA